MAISEQQLGTWSKQGPTGQFTATYDTIKRILNDSASPYYTRRFTIFLQGSYKNDTNVYGDSDVDIVIRLDEIYYSDLDHLSEDDKILFNAARSNASYGVPQFKSDVLSWLKRSYGAEITSGSKAIFIKGSGARRNADVLVCAKARRYFKFKSWQDQNYVDGICFFTSDGSTIYNFPTQHAENCTRKHQETNGWFKPTARILKNLRNAMVTNGTIRDGLAPSYFVEGLLYNVPSAQFGGTEQQNLRDILIWLNGADRSKFLCANERYYLFHPSSLVTWRSENCSAFLGAVINYWDKA